MITTFEIFAVFFGLTQSLLIMVNKRCNWIFYILQMFSMLMFSWMSHLYGDVINSCIYIIVGIISYIIWSKNKLSDINYANWTERLIWFNVLIIGTIIGSYFFKKTNNPLPTLDAFTTISSFIATILMSRHKIDAWIVWFINDIFYCIEYWLLPNQAFYLLSLNIIWTAMAIMTFFKWNNLRSTSKENSHV